MNLDHKFDQLSAHLINVALILGDYKKELLKQGFNEQEALQLVRDIQEKIA